MTTPPRQTAELLKSLIAAKVALGHAWQSTKDGLEPLRPAVEKIGQDVKALIADCQAALKAAQQRSRAGGNVGKPHDADPP